MSKLRWNDGRVMSVRLRDGSYVLAQLLKRPYIAFFSTFSDSDDWPVDAAETSNVLFICAVTGQFQKFSEIIPHSEVRSAVFDELPSLWISRYSEGSRRVTVWRGTPRERSFLTLGGRPGGRLIEKHIDGPVVHDPPVVMEEIPLDDDETIDAHELTSIWTYPNLNERLYLCKTLGRVVDPQKDVIFDRPIRDEFATYLDILAAKGTPEDWGYSSKAPGKSPKAAEPRNVVHLAFDVSRPGFPSADLVGLRDDLESDVADRGIGEVVHGRVGSEILEVDIRLKSARTRAKLDKLLAEMDLAAFVKKGS